MNTAGLSLDQSPPLSVPAPYFAAAPLFAVTAGLALAVAPELLQSRWHPATLALTHLLTLGCVAMVMLGAFQQLLPVLAGAPVPRPRLVGTAIFLLYMPGVVALAWGLASGARAPLVAASVLLGAALLAFIAVGAWCLARARSAHATVGAMSAALAALLVTTGLGLHLLSGHTGLSPLARNLTDLHAFWGLLGWVALLVIGVAYQVVPMFQITPDYPRPLLALLVPAVFVSLLAWSAARVAAPAAATWLGLLPATGLATFAATTLLLQHRRRRRLPDVTVDFWRLANGSLLVAVVIWGGSTVLGRPQPEVVLGALFVIGFAVAVLSGMSYKIVPFLVWLHLNNRIFVNPGLRGRIPNMKQIIPERRTRWHFRLHALALVALVLAAATGDLPTARVAGALFAAASALFAYNLLGALLTYRNLLRSAERASV